MVASIPQGDQGHEESPVWELKPVAILAVALTFPSATIPTGSRHTPWAAAEPWERMITQKVETFGGVVLQRSASLVTAAFGIPRALEQMPQRALHTARAIQRLTLVTEPVRPEPPPAAVRFAIHSGTLLVHMQPPEAILHLHAVGDTLELPARLVERASAGELVLSSQIAHVLEKEPLLQEGEMVVDTAAPPRLHTHEARRLNLAAPVRPTSGKRLSSPFVGRSHELATLHEHLAQASAGQGQIVGIVGEPGVGKSRLLSEFRRSLTSTQSTYLAGYCLPYGGAVPYLPVRHILRQCGGITDMDSPESILEKIHELLQAADMEPQEWAPYLQQLLGLRMDTALLEKLSSEVIRRQTFTGLRRLLSRLSQHQPLIIVVEDLQWLDKTSEAFFASLLESLASVPIFVLTTYRPGYRPPWIEKSYVTQLALKPLGVHDSLQVLQAIFQQEQVSDALLHELLAKAEGNPLFLEELAYAMRQYRDAPAHPALPTTIQGVLTARIDQLPATPKWLLQTASILGRTVPLKLLQVLWEEAGDLHHPLQELIRLEFLYEQVEAEEPVYLFKHALTQEAAYMSLPLDRRQPLHAAAGRALEALYADRPDGIVDHLAYHYARSAESEKALTYLTRCAAKAARSGAHVEAVASLQDALRHVEHCPPAERHRRFLDLTLRQALSLSVLGRFQQILELLQPQQELIEQLQEPTLTGPYYLRLGMTAYYLGEREQAVRNARHALEAAQHCRDQATMGIAYNVLALECSLAGQYRQGIAYGQKAVALLHPIEEQDWLGEAHWIVGSNASGLGDFEAALEAFARTRTLGEALENLRLQCLADSAAGWIYTMRGAWEAGITACQCSLNRSPDPVNTALALGFLGVAYLEKQEPSRAIPLLEQAVQHFTHLQLRHGQGCFTAWLAEALLADHQLEKASPLAHDGLEVSRDATYPYGVGLAQRTRGRIAQARGAGAEAARHFQEALQTFSRIQARYEIGRTYLALAELASIQGERERLPAYLQKARCLFTVSQASTYVERTALLANACGA